MQNLEFLLGGISFSSTRHSRGWFVEGIEHYRDGVGGRMEPNVTCLLAAATSNQNEPAIHVDGDKFIIEMKIFSVQE